MGTLHIRMLGAFDVGSENGASIALNSKAKSLLAYLLLHRSSPLTRQQVAFVFWPNSTEPQARANFRGLLRELRLALPDIDQYADIEGQNIQWRAGADCVLDVADFEQALAQAEQASRAKNIPLQRASLECAAERYRGDLLPSYYDDWVLVERERLQQAYCDALARLAGLLEAQSDLRAALVYAQRLLRQDDLREDAYRLLMRLHALSGDRAAVVRVFEECVLKLRVKLGVEPSAETRRAYENWRNYDPPHNDPPQVKLGGAAFPRQESEPSPRGSPSAGSEVPPWTPSPPDGAPPDPAPPHLERPGDRPVPYAKDFVNFGLPVASLVLFVAALHLQVVIAVPLSILEFLGLYFVLHPRSRFEVARDELRAAVLAKLSECRTLTGRVRALMPSVGKESVQEQIGRIVALAEYVVKKYAANEHTSLYDANYLEFRLSLILEVLNGYGRDAQVPAGTVENVADPNVQQTGGELLDEIESALKNLAVRADQARVEKLKVAIALLKNVLKMDGLSQGR